VSNGDSPGTNIGLRAFHSAYRQGTSEEKENCGLLHTNSLADSV